MNKRHLRRDIARLVRVVRTTIDIDCRASEEDNEPGIQLTVGATCKDWNYQTGDTSFTGGAYGYRVWGIASVYRHSNSYEVADDIINQLIEGGAFDKEVQS